MNFQDIQMQYFKFKSPESPAVVLGIPGPPAGHCKGTNHIWLRSPWDRTLSTIGTTFFFVSNIISDIWYDIQHRQISDTIEFINSEFSRIQNCNFLRSFKLLVFKCNCKFVIQISIHPVNNQTTNQIELSQQH